MVLEAYAEAFGAAALVGLGWLSDTRRRDRKAGAGDGRRPAGMGRAPAVGGDDGWGGHVVDYRGPGEAGGERWWCERCGRSWDAVAVRHGIPAKMECPRAARRREGPTQSMLDGF